MINSSKLNFQNIIKELLIVCFGVLIAMLLNSWNEKRKEKIQAQNYLVGIYEEVEANIKILKKSIPYHQGLLDDLRRKSEEANLSLNPSRVTNFAWKLSENNIFKENIDRQLYRQLAEAYQVHDYLMGTQIDAGKKMSEMNVMAPFYMANTIGKNISKEEEKKFESKVMSGWIPIFETWTYLEKYYLELLQEISKNAN